MRTDGEEKRCGEASAPTGDERKREKKNVRQERLQQMKVGVLKAMVAAEGRQWAEAWQTAKRIKYRSTTKAVSQGRLSHKSPSSATHLSPPTPARTSNLLLPRQRSATKTAPDMTKNKTADRCRYCHAECSLPPSLPPSPGEEKKQPAPLPRTPPEEEKSLRLGDGTQKGILHHFHVKTLTKRVLSTERQT